MYARDIERAADALRALHREQVADAVLAVILLALSLVATQAVPSLAVPMGVGAAFILARCVRVTVLRSDMLERLRADRDAYAIAEVHDRAAKSLCMRHRRREAAAIRHILAEPRPGATLSARRSACEEVLQTLAVELEDETLALEPAAAIACGRLLADASQSPLFNPGIPADDLNSQILRIRSGLTPRVHLHP